MYSVATYKTLTYCQTTHRACSYQHKTLAFYNTRLLRVLTTDGDPLFQPKVTVLLQNLSSKAQIPRRMKFCFT